VTVIPPADRDDLLQRVEDGWASFDERLERVPSDGFGRITSSGWTLGAMLGHLAAWHDATTYRLHRFAATRHEQPVVEADTDAFNARAASEVEGLSGDDVRLGLRASYERLREAILGVPELDPDGWVVAVVAENTYEHYDEHLGELEHAQTR
jgi:hypothetical protein